MQPDQLLLVRGIDLAWLSAPPRERGGLDLPREAVLEHHDHRPLRAPQEAAECAADDQLHECTRRYQLAA